MRKAFTFFSTIDSKLFILVEDGENPSLPSHLDIRGKELSKREGVRSFFSYESEASEVKGLKWRELLSISHFAKGDGAIVCEGLGELFPIFLREKSPLPKLFLKESFNHDTITFFGGSFNPWHEGHSECLRRCPSENVVIVPDRNPWKEEMEIDCFFKSFMELARRFEETQFSLFPGFYGLEQPNPTVDWLPRAEFTKKFLLIGDDNFCTFLKWKEVEKLANSLEGIFVLNRNHSQTEIEGAIQEILAINPNLRVEILGEHDFMSLSSTELRAKK
ncbi:hypothetical protein [Halobacteriovorax sp. JY17]|uniref:nicotinate-nicotinamide nucleotide adenylyltransferase n=1 Tax=Halobacteriovorax sp. JY17 TaxID=2014617 RepID=UPI0025C08892|nr:hypothetical protein [Halobacteriovorax sp. JY17]